jgi:uncharacterized protein YqeY
MTINQLQAEMIVCMKQGDRERKAVISDLIAQIKKAAIDKGCRDNIDEKFVNTELIKIQKSVKEQVDTCPETRPDLLEKYKAELEIINEFAPALISSPSRIAEILRDEYEGPIDKKNLMKFLNANFRGRMDMGVAVKVVDVYISEVSET